MTLGEMGSRATGTWEVKEKKDQEGKQRCSCPGVVVSQGPRSAKDKLASRELGNKYPDLLTLMLLLLLPSHVSRVRLCDPIDSSPPGSPVPGILQARTLEWVAISFSSA